MPNAQYFDVITHDAIRNKIRPIRYGPFANVSAFYGPADIGIALDQIIGIVEYVKEPVGNRNVVRS